MPSNKLNKILGKGPYLSKNRFFWDKKAQAHQSALKTEMVLEPFFIDNTFEWHYRARDPEDENFYTFDPANFPQLPPF